MVARVAPSPIAVAVAIGDARTRNPDYPPPSPDSDSLEPGEKPLTPDAGGAAPPDPPPLHARPGQAFDASLIAGRLPPRPTTDHQLRQRLRAVWEPPASSFRLMDLTA